MTRVHKMYWASYESTVTTFKSYVSVWNYLCYSRTVEQWMTCGLYCKTGVQMCSTSEKRLVLLIFSSRKTQYADTDRKVVEVFHAVFAEAWRFNYFWSRLTISYLLACIWIFTLSAHPRSSRENAFLFINLPPSWLHPLPVFIWVGVPWLLLERCHLLQT